MSEPIPGHEGHRIQEIRTYASSLIRRFCHTCQIEIKPYEEEASRD